MPQQQAAPQDAQSAREQVARVEGVQIEEASEDEELEPSDVEEPASAAPAAAEPPPQAALRAGASARIPDVKLSDVQADLQVSCDPADIERTTVTTYCSLEILSRYR